jgi:protease-4
VFSFLGKLLKRLIFALGLSSLIGVVGMLVIFFALRSEAPKTELPGSFVLTLNAGNGISPLPADPLLSQLMPDEAALDLYSTLEALKHAATDARVKAVFLDLTGSQYDLTMIEEIGGALAALRAAGKPVVAFSETFSEGENSIIPYLAATYSGEIWMQPYGMVALLGVGAEVPFFKDALERLGARFETEHRNEAKTAFNSFTENGFTPAHRAQTEKLLRDVLAVVSPKLTTNRPALPPLESLFAEGFYMGQGAVDKKLVDQLGYIDDVRARLFALYNGGTALEGAVIPADEDWLVSIERYHGGKPESLLKTAYLGEKKDKAEKPAALALVYMNGEIVRDTDGGFGGDEGKITAAQYSEVFADIAADASIKAVVLRIDSPGGGFTASDTLRNAINTLRENHKTIIISMGSVAASGGYMLASAGDKIFALPGTITGSIGVIGGKPVFQDAASKLGVKVERVGTGDLVNMFSPLRSFNDKERAAFRRQVDFSFAAFKEIVAESRGLNPAEIDTVSGGHVFFGEEAVRLKLVDALGGLDAAISEAQESSGQPKDQPLEVRLYPQAELPWLAFLQGQFGGLVRATLHAAFGLPYDNSALKAQAAIPAVH